MTKNLSKNKQEIMSSVMKELGKTVHGILENYDSKDDIAALNYFERLFPNLKIIPIYAKPLIKGQDGGGALHCVTWEYIEKNDSSVPLTNSL